MKKRKKNQKEDKIKDTLWMATVITFFIGCFCGLILLLENIGIVGIGTDLTGIILGILILFFAKDVYIWICIILVIVWAVYGISTLIKK